jgi:hypothetical protein
MRFEETIRDQLASMVLKGVSGVSCSGTRFRAGDYNHKGAKYEAFSSVSRIPVYRTSIPKVGASK